MENQREVDGQEGRNLAEDNEIAFFETSARTGSGVDECFMHLARKVKEQMAFRDSGGGFQRAEGKRGVIKIDASGNAASSAPNHPPCWC